MGLQIKRRSISTLETNKIHSLLDLDWESIWKQIQSDDSKTTNSYIVTVNKGQDNEYQTRFMNYHEALDLISMAVEKKKLRIKLSPIL